MLLICNRRLTRLERAVNVFCLPCMKSSKTVTLEDFVRFNKLRRILFKFQDRDRYYELKTDAKRLEFVEGFDTFALPEIPVIAPGRLATFKHSGNAGDTIYALPSLRVLAGESGAKLSLALNVPLRNRKLIHPLGGVQLNQKMYDMLEPLLSRQEYIKELAVHDGRSVDFDLDVTRDAPFRTDRLGICRWYFYVFGITCDLSQPWLKVDPDPTFKDRIVVARSKRYRNLTFSYKFLQQYGAPVFVGLADEYEDFRSQVPQAEWVEVKDFHQLARVIAGSRLFIGNQSFPYAIAEGLKVPRVLELDPGMPNVVPAGEQGYDVLYQQRFEEVVGRLMKVRPV